MVWSPSHRLQTVKNAAYPAGATSKASASGVLFLYMVASTASLKRLEDLQHGRVMWQHGKSVYMCLLFCCRCGGSFFVRSLRFEATKNAPGSATTETRHRTEPRRGFAGERSDTPDPCRGFIGELKDSHGTTPIPAEGSPASDRTRPILVEGSSASSRIRTAPHRSPQRVRRRAIRHARSL